MALINKIDNVASITFNGTPVTSNSVETLLSLAPTITKTVDKLLASVGDNLVYTVLITNVGLTTITNLPFTDVIADGATYVADSFKVNGVAATPTITNKTLTYTIPTIAALGVMTVTFQVTVTG